MARDLLSGLVGRCNGPWQGSELHPVDGGLEYIGNFVYPNVSNASIKWRPEALRHKYYMTVQVKFVILLLYGIMCVISAFGNTIVCYVIFKNKRLHTPTNFFIANLAISDLLVTFVNVPFNLARNLLVDWPFGEVPCHLVNYTLILTSYVSTYTLTSIALDRHRVVLKPLSRRMSRRFAISILVLLWIVAICLSLPYGLYMKVRKLKFLITSEFNRCRFIPPRSFAHFETYLTVSTFVLQYCVPFTLIAVAYGRIVQSLWARTHVGAVTATQQQSQARAKRKSIKLLIAVVVVFAICWLPLNMYHLLTDLYPDAQVFSYNSLAFFSCHWIAISSTCYNPFVYCWLNDNFRQEVKSRFSWIYRFKCVKKNCGRAQSKLGGRKANAQKGERSGSPSGVISSMRITSGKRETITAFELICDGHNNKCAVCEPLAPDSTTFDADDHEVYELDEATRDLILHLSANGGATAAFRNGSHRL